MYRFATALMILLAVAFTASAADWPQWLGPKRDGGTAESIEVWKETPKVLWRAKVGVGFSTPVVVDGRVFVHARVNGKEREELIAFDAKTGKLLWREPYHTRTLFERSQHGASGDADGHGKQDLYVRHHGNVELLRYREGDASWQVDTFKKLNATLPRFGVCCSPLVIGNRVLVAVNGKGSSIAAYDTDTGELQWQALDEPASTSSPVLFATKGKTGSLPDAVFMTTLRVIGLNPLDGSVNWEYSLPFQPSGTSPTPVVSGDTIVTSTMTNGSTAIRITGGEKITAEKLWQAKTISGYFSSGTTVGKDRIFLVTNQLKPVPRADLVCLDAASGEKIWRKDGVGYFHFGSYGPGTINSWCWMMPAT